MSTKNQAYHPYRVILFFALLGISSMFLLLSIAYIITMINNDFEPLALPVLFHVNTAVILLCSYYIQQAYKAAKSNDQKAYENGITATFVLGLLFVVLQLIAWTQLFHSGVSFSNLSGSYLYAISGIHALHVLAGLVPLGITFYRIKRRERDPVQSVIFETNPDSMLKVRLLATYWHFIDILWLYLYLFFLINIFVL